MRTCPECKTQFDESKNFCPACGKYLPRIAENAPDSSPDPVAKLLNIDVPNLTEDNHTFESSSFSKVFKENLYESSPSKALPGNPTTKEVSWETAYKGSRTEAPVSSSASAARVIYSTAPSQENASPVDFEDIVKREAATIEKNEVPSIGSFALTAFLFTIPVVGVIYMVALAFGITKYPAKVNLARGVLLFWLMVCFAASLAFLIAVLGFGFDPKPAIETFWDVLLEVIEIFEAKF